MLLYTNFISWAIALLPVRSNKGKNNNFPYL